MRNDPRTPSELELWYLVLQVAAERDEAVELLRESQFPIDNNWRTRRDKLLKRVAKIAHLSFIKAKP